MYRTNIYIYIYIYIHILHIRLAAPRGALPERARGGRAVHPVSITRFPLSRFSPGAGLLRNPFFYTIHAKIFQGLGPKRRESCNGDRVYEARDTYAHCS